MAGFIFSIGSNEQASILETLIKEGWYSTNLSAPKNNKWNTAMVSTLGDYLTMKPGDNIYFFSKRKIYGIGTLVSLKGDCKYCNYPNATEPKEFAYEKIKESMLIKHPENMENRFVCFFEPEPAFFKEGIDMDEALSYKPESYKSLRVFWKRSFIKLDDEENMALKELFYLKNEQSIEKKENTYEFDDSFHDACTRKINNDYTIKIEPLINSVTDKDKLTNEMVLEVSTLKEISTNPNTIFGHWDYLSHQVCASPFKPVDYMEKIDIYGYRKVKNSTAISKFLVMEIKKDIAAIDSVTQIAKYIDWIAQNNTYGNYDRIEAFILAYDFEEEVKKEYLNICKRTYTYGSHPTLTKTWANIRLIQYRCQNDTIEYTEVTESS